MKNINVAMIKSIYLLIGMVLVFYLTGCKKDKNDNLSSGIEYIKYGTSFGECIGYCKKDVTLTISKIDFHKSGWNIDESLPDVTLQATMNTSNWTTLIDKINFDLFLELDSVIGCPDCADGGAEWIEIKAKKIKYKVVFEYGNEPEETKDYIGHLRSYLNEFQIEN